MSRSNRLRVLEAAAIVIKETGKDCSEWDLFNRAWRTHGTFMEDNPTIAFASYEGSQKLPLYVEKFCEAMRRRHIDPNQGVLPLL